MGHYRANKKKVPPKKTLGSQNGASSMCTISSVFQDVELLMKSLDLAIQMAPAHKRKDILMDTCRNSLEKITMDDLFDGSMEGLQNALDLMLCMRIYLEPVSRDVDGLIDDSTYLMIRDLFLRIQSASDQFFAKGPMYWNKGLGGALIVCRACSGGQASILKSDPSQMARWFHRETSLWKPYKDLTIYDEVYCKICAWKMQMLDSKDVHCTTMTKIEELKYTIEKNRDLLWDIGLARIANSSDDDA